MNENSLMLNDWVLDDNEPVQVTTYMLRCMELGIDSCDIIQPIPITQEILEKNGFHKESSLLYNVFIEWASKDQRIMLDQLSNSIGKEWCVHIDNEDFESIGNADIQYVHELQHALRLCGIEKKIML